MSIQPILPDVSYVTVVDFHNTFCFMCAVFTYLRAGFTANISTLKRISAVEAFLTAAMSDHSWVILSGKFRIYPVFAAALLFLVLEHVVLFLLLQGRFARSARGHVPLALYSPAGRS